MRFCQDSGLVVTKNKFGVRLDGDTLFVPILFKAWMDREELNTPDDLAVLVAAGSLDLVKLLGWTREEVEQAAEDLRTLLEPFLSPALVHSMKHPPIRELC